MNARIRHLPHSTAGFTLIELITVVVLLGIVATMTSAFIATPMQGYVDLARRAELVDAAESALRLMARDIRRALPFSVRVSGGTALELLNVVDGGRYRAEGPGDELLFNGADTTFDVLGPLQNPAAVDTTNHWLVVHNLTDTGADYNAYSAPNVGRWNRVSLNGGSSLNATPPRIVLDGGLGIPTGSPRRRFYIVDGPVSYLCDTTARTLIRYSGYAITTAQPTDAAQAPLSGNGALLTKHVQNCSFIYDRRDALVTLRLELRDGGESIRLMHQIHVDNVP